MARSDSFTGNSIVAYTANSLQSLELLQTGTSQLTTGGDTYLMPQRFTVLRIVGDMVIRNGSLTLPCIYTLAVYLVDEVGSTADAMNPTVISNADKSWLWMKHGILEPQGTSGCSNMTHLPGGAHVDIRVKRVMRADQSLRMFIAASQDMSMEANFRTLVSRVA